MAQEKTSKKQMRPSKHTKMTLKFTENGDPEGRSLQEILESSPPGTTITINGKTFTRKKK